MSGGTDEAAGDGKVLATFLAGLDVSLACPRCRNKSWWNMGSKEVHTTERQVGIHFLSTYAVACQKCGLIQEHVSAIVEGRIKAT
jgi:predicted nucleic-acid-binding Zn-ribbon protein